MIGTRKSYTCSELHQKGEVRVLSGATRGSRVHERTLAGRAIVVMLLLECLARTALLFKMLHTSVCSPVLPGRHTYLSGKVQICNTTQLRIGGESVEERYLAKSSFQLGRVEGFRVVGWKRVVRYSEPSGPTERRLPCRTPSTL
jgi:hypothetical protein